MTVDKMAMAGAATTADANRFLAITRLHQLHADIRRGYRPRSTSRRVARALLEGLRSVFAASTWAGSQQWARAVERGDGITRQRQSMQRLVLAAKYGFTARDYYAYRMHQFSAGDAAAFLPLREHIRLREHLYDQLGLNRALLKDKRLFCRAASQSGLAVPTTIADFEAGSMRWWDLDRLPACDLFVKEAKAKSGRGAALWRFDPVTRRWIAGETAVDQDGLLRHLCELSRAAPYVLQRRLLNHPRLAELGAAGLCTARIVTLRSPGTTDPMVLLAYFRITTGDAVADNYDLGNIACPIELSSGMLGQGLRKGPGIVPVKTEVHPDSNVRLQGFSLPAWHEACAVATRAHRLFREFPSVGWDVALTPEGPVLVEGNYAWGADIAQQATATPLCCRGFAEHLLLWFQEAAKRSGKSP